MSLLTSKLYKRIHTSGSSVLNQFAPTIASFALSWAVSRYLNIALWGEFAYVVMLVNLLLAVCGYGSKDYVLQRVSLQPSQLNPIWSTDFTSRLILLPLVLAVVLLTAYSLHMKIMLMIWIIAGYVNKSFESRLSYDRKFLASALLDFSVYAVLIACILVFRKATLVELVSAQIALHCLRAVYWMVLYFPAFKKTHFRFRKTHFPQAFYFFLPQVIGFIGSRADFYVSMRLLEKTELGMYQLLAGFLILFQGGIAALAAPYLKNIYRLPFRILRKLSLRLFAIGFPLYILYLALIYLTFCYVYRLNYDRELFRIAILQGIPYLLYVLYYSRLFNIKPAFVSLIHVAAILASVSVGWLLIPEMGMKGALWANCASQWVLCILMFCFVFRLETKASKQNQARS